MCETSLPGFLQANVLQAVIAGRVVEQQCSADVGPRLMECNIGVCNQVVTGISRQLVCCWVAFWVERRSARYIVPQIVLSYDLQRVQVSISCPIS